MTKNAFRGWSVYGNNRHITKTLLVMKLTVVLLTAAILNVSAAGISQTVTLKGKDISLMEIFSVIKQQTGYVVIANASLVDKAHPVTISAINSPLKNFLDQVFRDQPLQFSMKNTTIVISLKTTGVGSSDLQFDNTAPPPISGIIRDLEGNPLAGINIAIKGTNRGVVTDAYGNFIIDANINEVLIISAINYGTKEIKIGSANTPLNISLERSVSPLDEVQIIAYGQTSTRFSTGNVSTVKAADIEKQPVTNPLLALQGRVPGLFITQNSGVPGSGISVQIRGQNSIGNGNDPLYIIDGVPYTSQLLPNLSSDVLQQSSGNYYAGGNPLSFINPLDIDNISILKDADATAIYGSRGANGVVLITTKKGRAGSTAVTLSLSSGIGQVSRKVDLLNPSQYLHMRREAFKNDDDVPTVDNAPDLLYWDTTRSTDWQKELIGGTAHYTNAQASLSGGNDLTQYLISTNYNKESTVFPGDFSDQKTAVHLNINSTSSNRKFTANFSANYMVDNNNLPAVDLGGSVALIYLPPNAPEPFNADGTLNWANSTWPGFTNPFAITKRKYKAQTNNLLSNLNISYQLLKDLELKCSFGYTNLQVEEISTFPISSSDPLFAMKGSASFTNNSIRSWIAEPQVTYRRIIGEGRLEVLLGTTFQQNKNKGQIEKGDGYNSDLLLENIQAAPTLFITSVTNTDYKYTAAFARINYILSNKYIVNLTGRRDGSSRFGDNNKLHNFGSVGLAWNFSYENFIQNNLPFLSFGKIRTSYGTTGNDQIGEYRFLDLYNTFQSSYQGTIGLTPSNLYNPNLAWEETKKWEVALDLGFLKDRILINTVFYKNRSSNQLLEYILPTVTGFSGISSNFPATVQNTGWEFTVSTNNIKSLNFNWNSSINLSIPRNKLISFPGFESSGYQSSLVIGAPLNIRKVFQMVGVNDTTGNYQFLDIKGNITSTPTYVTDQTAIANTAPDFYGGISNSLSFRGVQLDFLFQFTKQRGINPLFSTINPGRFGLNQNVAVLDRWQASGDKPPIQRFSQSPISSSSQAYPFGSQSDHAFTDASFIRLKNLSLSYQLPDNLIKKIHFKSCKVYLSSQNLLTITNYIGLDPENSVYKALPPLRVITLGIQVSM